MDKLYCMDLLYASWIEIEMDHYWLRDCALKAFDRSANSFTEAFAKKCRDRLKKEIRESFEKMSESKLAGMCRQDVEQAGTHLGNTVGSLFLSAIPVVGSLYDHGRACVDGVTEKMGSLEAQTRAHKRLLRRASLRDRLCD